MKHYGNEERRTDGASNQKGVELDRPHYQEAKAADNKTNSQSHMEPSG